jgi:glycosyltransferase involved in cell wall biosynthesis
MNVAIFTDNDFAKVNGVTTALKAVLEHAPDNVTARVYTCERRRVDRSDYLALEAFGVGIPFYPEMDMYLPPLRRFVRQVVADGIDVIHLTTPGPVGLAAMYAAWRLGIRMVGSFHTDLAEYTRLLSGSVRLGTLMQEYMRWPYGRCERILVPSEATRRTLINGKIDPAKIDLWRRGVSTDRFTPAKRSDALRQRWGVGPDRPALLYVGRVSKEKGLHWLGPTAQSLARAGIDHRFIIVGDGPLRAELESSHPTFVFTGTLPPDDVAVAMASADIFLFPSRTDTAGNVVLEAQASGLPVLVTDVGGPRENMIDRSTGVVCPDLDDFVRRAAELALNAAHRARLGQGARRYALGRRWDLALEPLYRLYLDTRTTETAPRPVRRHAAVAR